MSKRFSGVLRIVGNSLILVSLLFIFLTFAPAGIEEVKYQSARVGGDLINQTGSLGEIEPINKDFSIVIPKINAYAPVISGVDPFDKEEYLMALKNGVAHARGSALPNQSGNTYIFAHSTDSFYNVGRYNAVFYLISKLTSGDLVVIYYKGVEYTYEVADKRVVDPDELEYLNYDGVGDTLTLQTCYPPGTTLRRLVVIGKKIDNS